MEHEQQGPSGTVSLRAEVPEPLLRAMAAFIERHPNWDQYRLFQAALAGFLVQHGVKNRDVTRCYLANLFPGAEGFAPLPSRAPRSRALSGESLHGGSPQGANPPEGSSGPRPWPRLAA
jgi:hypothetical protein